MARSRAVGHRPRGDPEGLLIVDDALLPDDAATMASEFVVLLAPSAPRDPSRPPTVTLGVPLALLPIAGESVTWSPPGGASQHTFTVDQFRRLAPE